MTQQPKIIYHSQSGSAARIAGHASRALHESERDHCLYRAEDCGSKELAAASGLLLICAENSGRLSGGAKDFLDRIFYPAQRRGLVLPYALVVTAGNDGRGAVSEAQRILSGIPFVEALPPIVIRGEDALNDLSNVEEFALGFAEGLAMGIF